MSKTTLKKNLSRMLEIQFELLVVEDTQERDSLRREYSMIRPFIDGRWVDVTI